MDVFGVGGGNFTGGRNVSFNLSTGAVMATDGPTASIEARANAWYRIRMTFTASAAPSASALFIRFLDNSNNFSYAGDGTSGIYLWGAQLEAGAFPTSYIPTTTAAVTRSADVASISGSNFSAWYRSTESTVFANWENLAATMPSGSAQWLAEFSDGTTSNRQSLFQIQAANSLVSQNSFVSGSGAGRLDAGGAYSKIVVKASAAFASLDRALAANGGLATVSSAGNIPIGINRLDVGASLGTAHLNGAIRRLTYWPTRLPNSTLQAVTQ
jgi:hypothetical protein